MRTLPFAAGTLFLLACATDNPDLGVPQAPPHDVAIVKNAAFSGGTAFSPASLTISLADTTQVTWYNADIIGSGSYGGISGTSHRLISDDGTTFHGTTIPPGSSFKATLSATGTFPYHCELHPNMVGTLTVNP